MKTTKTVLAGLFLILSVTITLAQSNPGVIAVVNSAEWCPTCEKNGERAMNTFMENNKDGAIKFIINDLTNNQTKSESEAKLAEVGLKEAAKNYKSTGLVYFFNVESKQMIHKVSVAKPDDMLVEAINLVKNN